MTRTGILIVEDEGIVARDIERQLLGLGYHPVAIAMTGEEAVALAASLSPQLVLMDIHLAGGAMDGIDAALAIRRRFSIPSVFLTAYATDEVVDRSKAAEPLGYIIKPFDEHSLRTTVEIALHKDRLDRQLRHSESRYRAVVQSAHDAVVTVDKAGTIVGWSPSAAAIFGYDEAEVLGQPVTLLIPARHRERHLAGMQRTQSGIAPLKSVRQLEGLRKDGSELPLELSLAKWEGPEGWFITGMFRDISERKQTEDRLRIAGLVLNNSPAVLFRWKAEPGWPVSYVSENVERQFGYSVDDLVSGRVPFSRLVHPDDAARLAQEVDEHSTRGTSRFTQEYRIITKSGDTRWVDDRTVVERDSAGRILWYEGILQDITEQRRLREQLTQAQKMEVVGRLAGGIAHDFNNLLTVINGTADIALMDLPSEHPLADEFRHILEAGNRAAQLTRQLLAFSRRQVLSPVALNLSTHVHNTQSILQRLIGEDITLVIDGDPELKTVLADPGQMEQVILNLAVNACDAMPGRGRLTIATRNVMLDEAFVAAHPDATAGPHVVMTVTDTGSGMPPEVLARIFEPFFTTKGQGKGTGLGLATVYGIVKQSRGCVLVSSTPGEGTVFQVYLPVATAVLPAADAPTTARPVRGTGTILLAEDEDGLRALATRMLQSSGYEVIAARSGEEALERLGSHDGPIALLFTDVMMTGISGLVLARQAQAARPGLRVLFSSGYSDDRVSSEVANDAHYFIAKPYTVQALAKKVRAILDEPAATA